MHMTSDECRERGFKRVVVRLNGVNYRRVVEADEERGFIVAAARNQDGSVKTKNNYIVWEKIEGDVHIFIGGRK